MIEPAIPTAAVTGAASGIGRALSCLLAERGYALRLADIDRSGLEAVSSTLKAEFSTMIDVGDSSAVQTFADAIGAVDVLCLNAGVLSTSMAAPWEASPEEWDRVLRVNLFGVVNGLRAFIPMLLAQDTPARVLITASLAGAVTWPGGGPYAASKHAVMAVAEQAAMGLADSNVSVTVLCPALVRTAMSDQGEDPFEVAARALAAMDEGQFAVLPHGWSAAVHARALRLTSGRQPTSPMPNRSTRQNADADTPLPDTDLSDLQLRVQAAAFAILFQRDEPATEVAMADLASLGHSQVSLGLTQLDDRGMLRRNDNGDVVGIAGLTIVPTQHQIEIDHTIRWTWCALDAVGIIGALRRGGRFTTTVPGSKALVTVEIDADGTTDSSAVVFIADGFGDDLVADTWCPTVNLFPDSDAATAWADSAGVTGRPVTVNDLIADASVMWEHVTGMLTG